ncbi:P-loop containing nucleoside triphosphate hydrolase protein [Dioscorea alata]|uniref:P-loop containing nucleoside triphosphate hydrolase protein n=1 Tax=Dioscorea alata TaxID=55571 RepID=A0ACB7UNS3_DIOAL|nr:P-loop containing nucleoside triphosphate hydrolase protein [Dioscorea alata]
MGGAGKTTLVKEVAKQAKKQKLFGEVVMVTVSQNIDLKRIQRAVKLAERLATTQNKILVILDDLWEPLHLPMVGIRLPEMVATCKVVITTRNKDVCKRMSCREIIELKTLLDEESWDLFKSRAGDAVDSLMRRELTQNIVKECATMPLALVVLGEALKGKSPKIWGALLMGLIMSEVDLPGVSKQDFKSIQLSFDFLESEAAKSCFFHCCLYPEDYDIPKEELMHMMVGGGLLIGVETLNDAQGIVDILLNQLKARALLLQGSSEGYVRMHDVVRDVAIQISAKDHGFYVQDGQGWRDWPENIDPNCRRLSLMGNDIQDLSPGPMEYPRLETLILRGNKRLASIPEMFLRHMGSLMVLDLSSTRIKSLPKSVSCLTNLRVLNLRNCHYLKDISHINGLKMLEILILEGCPVSIAPEGVGWPQNLRFVNLSCSVDDYFSKEFPRFRWLEQLFMNKFAGSFQELIISLRHLTHLFIAEVDLDDPLSHELVSPSSWPDRLLKFSLSFLKDRPWNWHDSIDRRGLKLMGTKPLALWVKRLRETTTQLALVEFQETELIPIDWLSLSSLQYLELVNWPNLTKMLGDELLFHEQISFSQLKEMIIDNCPRLTSLLPFSLWQKLEGLRVKDCPMMLELFPCLFPALEILNIRDCQEMSEMISPPASLQAPCFFQRLRELHIKSCPRLTHLFSYKQAIGMQHLTHLYIQDCAALEAVVISTENKDEASASTSTRIVDHESFNSLFPNLTNLFLFDLPQLNAFNHPAALPIGWLYLKYPWIKKCPKLQLPLLRAYTNPQTSGIGREEEEEQTDDADREGGGDSEPDWKLEG